jgi:hypothetical protein
MNDFFDDDALPIHHLDDDFNGQRGVCPESGRSRDAHGGCPRGCSGAREHYSNDGHRACHDPIDASAASSWLGERIFGKQDLGRRPGT